MHTAYVSVRQGLLALLDQADMYGYQLRSEFEAYTGGAWPLNIGQVYTTLERLERDGLVAITHPGDGDGESDTGGREHKYYAITRAGRDTLRDWFEATPADDPPPRDELLAKVLLALAGGREHALAVVTRQRTALTAALQARRRELRSAHATVGAGTEAGVAQVSGTGTGGAGAGSAGERGAGPRDLTGVAPLLVTDALVARAEADLRWLDVCEARLAQLAPHAGNGTTPTDGTGGR
jgi:DNA-binding PadR family transcriptional regulator